MQSLNRFLEKRPWFIAGRDPNPQKETTIHLRGSLEAPVLPRISTRIWTVPPGLVFLPPARLCEVGGDFGLPSCQCQVNRSSASVSKIKSLRGKKKKINVSEIKSLDFKSNLE